MRSPNLRRLLIPPFGHYIADVDLAQADARVVAWEAGDKTLKAIFLDPTRDLHIENTITLFGRCTGKNDPNRNLAKRGVHAVNYGASARTLALSLDISLKEAERFINLWFTAHPDIYNWHQRILRQLQTTRTIYNAFGFRRVYFDRVDGLLPEALAWIPQSTVAETINRACCSLYYNHPEVDIKLQIHDSLVFTFPVSLYPNILPTLYQALHITIPYSDPLIIPVGLAISTKSWGDVKRVNWPEFIALPPRS